MLIQKNGYGPVRGAGFKRVPRQHRGHFRAGAHRPYPKTVPNGDLYSLMRTRRALGTGEVLFRDVYRRGRAP